MRWLYRCSAVLVGIGTLSSVCAIAQTYPTRPVRMIVPFPPGGSTDIMARLLGQKLSEALGQQVVIDNRGGAGGTIGTDIASKSPPDGHTLLMSSSITHTVGPSLYKKLPYNVINDFAPITMIASVPLLLAVNPSVPARSVKELIVLAKSKPRQLNYASAGNGTSPHLATEMFKQMAGIDIVHVPYKGGGPAVIDLISGQVHMIIISTVATLPHVKAGKLRALALTSRTRLPELPDIPTVAESGLPGYEVVLWYGVFAPANTPRNVVMRLNRSIVKIMQTAEMRERLASEGGRPVGNTPEEFEESIKAEVARWAKVVREAAIRID